MNKRMAGAALIGAVALTPGVGMAQATNSGQGLFYGTYATEPRYGSPNSMQFQANQVALDLDELDPDGGVAQVVPLGDADTIGGAFTYFNAGGDQGERYEGHYQHARRLGEGSRARLVIDVPLHVLHANTETLNLGGSGSVTLPGGTAVYGTVSAGVEFQAKPTWLITPRIAYSNLQAGKHFAGDGELATASLTSRWGFARLGRGEFTLGDEIGYSHTLKTFLSRQPFFSSSDTFNIRNGVAYQLPLKSRMFGRQSSLRASYTFTYMTGDGLAFKQLHEAGINIGVRSREVERKNSFEMLRVGLLYTHGINEFYSKASYDAVTATVGYRF